MAQVNVDGLRFVGPDKTVLCPSWEFIMGQVEPMMNTLINKEDLINEDLKTMDAKLAEWAGDETTISYNSFDPVGSNESVFDQLSALMVEQASVISSMSNHLTAIELKGGGVGETIEPGTTYTVSDVTYTTGIGTEIFNNYTDAGLDLRNKAAGKYTHVEGSSNGAYANYSHAEGNGNTVTGICGHAEGAETKASGEYSHAEGYGSKATGYYSHAEGHDTIAAGSESHAEGVNNTINSSASDAHVEGFSNTVSGFGAHAEGGNNTIGTNANSAHAEGYSNTVTAAYAHVEGYSCDVHGANAHAEGCDTLATGIQSHAEGNMTQAHGAQSHVEGSNTVCAGTATSGHAEGHASVASGDVSHAQNESTLASGSASTAMGDHSTASGSASTAMGYYTIANGTNQLALGRYNISDTNNTYAMIIGNGDSSDRSDAFKVDWDGKIYVGNNNGVDVSGLYVTSNDDAKVLTATYQNGVGTYSWAPASGGAPECVIVTDTSTSLPNKVVIENNHEYRYLSLVGATGITISIETVDISKSFYSTVVLHNVTSTDILSNFVSVSQASVLSNVIFLNEDFVDLNTSDTVEMLFFTNGMANSVMCIAYGYTSASPEPPAPIPDPDINEDKYNVYNLTTGETTIYDDQASAAAYLNANTNTNFDVYMGTNVATPATDPGYGDYGVYITTDWQNVSNLRKFTCNNKVTKVSEGAFRNSSLAEFIRGNGAGFQNSYYVYFESGCFYGCTNMKSFDIYPPEGVTPPGACQFVTWDDEGIFEASGLETFTGGDVIDVMGVAATAWGKNMFKDCTSLTTVALESSSPQLDNELAEGMFSGCTALTTINVMDPGLIYWPQDALVGCSDVTINRHDYVDTSRRTTWDEAGKPWGANSVTINTIYDLE